MLSTRTLVDIEAGALGVVGDVKLRVALGPVGALRLAGPRGGERA